MFNITVNLRKLVKKIIVFFIIFLIGIISIKLFKKIYYLIDFNYSKIINNELSIEDYQGVSFEKGFQRILKSELIICSNNFENENNEISDTEKINENSLEFEKEIEENKGEQAIEVNSQATNEKIDLKNLKTEIISDKNLKESYNTEYNGVKVKNESNYLLTQDILKPDVEFKNKDDILIFHTHTCESYTKTEKNNYIETGNFRTTDLNYSVAKVGDELEKYLTSKNFNVIHDKTYHDYPAYTGSYNRSFLTVQGILEKNPNIQMVIDLHRDAIGNESSYGPSVKIGEEKVAQLMFVIGTDGGGLNHPNWNNNLKYAVKIQEKANEIFPGLFRPIIVRNSRYNQNLADGACIIEVGATGNTLEESLSSMKYLSEILYEVMKQ